MAKRLGIYIFTGAEIVDWAGPWESSPWPAEWTQSWTHFLSPTRFAPAMATANLFVNPRYGLDQAPDMDAFLIPEALARGRKCTTAAFWIL